MDSNDRERVEEARAELKKMVKKKEMNIVQLHNIMMLISNGHHNLMKGDCVISLGAMIEDGLLQ